MSMPLIYGVACVVVVFGLWWLSMAYAMYLGEVEWAELTGEDDYR